MNIEFIFKASIATVGVVQLLKNIVTHYYKGSFPWTIVTIIVASLLSFLPLSDNIYTGLLVISGSSIFYDTIYKAFERIFKRDIIFNPSYVDGIRINANDTSIYSPGDDTLVASSDKAHVTKEDK